MEFFAATNGTVIALVGGIIFFTIVWAIMSYNRLRALEARCSQAHNDIDAQLKQRSDLVPNLVEIVRGFVGQENNLLNIIRDVQRDITNAAGVENHTKNNASISNTLSSVFSSLESIPELRSSQHYITLRNQILEIEDRITASRRYLNLTVSEFNAKRAQFPGGLIASVTRIGERGGYTLGQDRVFHEDAPVIKL